ncbi:MAG: bifunctional phosphopantothenoylcysteine decarboxylase/phosphopantothenate--cysteine ligase CoaBC [Chitinophagales bacterium]
MSLRGKKILLGVCGGIAAYKCVYLVRSLMQAGADVRVIMTPAATDFVGKLSFASLTRKPVYSTFYNKEDGTWNNHVELGLWGDIYLIAPATANTIASMAHGESDTLVLATYLSASCPVIIAPAMDLDMWQHPATQENIQLLAERGVHIIPPESGSLASGLEGTGRLAEPDQIQTFVESYFAERKGPLQGKKVLITAGPTYEAIDPVRFIGNHASGKMGFALAEACINAGAEVIIVHGPVSNEVAMTSAERVAVTSAEEMYTACSERFDACDIFIAAAAVADFTPVQVSAEKIKKEGATAHISLELKRTKDILAEMSKRRHPGQCIVGFALETENALENARKKLESKDLDLLVLNSLRDPGAGFGYDTNKITILDRQGDLATFDTKHKSEVARDIIHRISLFIHA